MKNLDLNGLGVQEMNATVMRATDGGFLTAFIIAAAWFGIMQILDVAIEGVYGVASQE